MQQPQYKSNFELKLIAKIQTGQRFGILLGTIVLKFIITSLAADLVTSLVSTKSITGAVINYILRIPEKYPENFTGWRCYRTD